MVVVADEVTAGKTAKVVKRASAAKETRSLSQRLLSALTGEVRALERTMRAAAAEEEAGAADKDAAIAPGAKARVDAIGSLTRTLEKLLDLARVETAIAKGGADEESEAERLRAELMKRLKALDARRGGGRRLFSAGIAPGAALA